MKIVPKLTAALFVGMCLVLAGNAYRRVRRETSALDAERRRKDDLVARSVAGAFEAAWRVSGEQGAAEQLTKILAAIDEMDARWFPVEAPLPAPARGSSLATQPGGRPLLVSPPSARVWYTYVPVDVAGRREGYVEIEDKAPGSAENTRRIVFDSAMTALTLMLASALLAFALNHWLIGLPIRVLTRKARQIAHGEFTDPADLGTRDELGELAEELNATSARLVTTLEQLRHADRLATLGKVSAGLAHELGTPLAVVSARAEMILGGSVSPEAAREYAKAIGGAAERMTRIVRQLLQFARRSAVERASHDVGDLAREAVELVRPVARRHDVEVSVSAPVETRALVDAGQLQQVVTNLVMNAVHASKPGSEVEVRVAARVETPPADIGGAARACVCVDVVDHGHGIAPENVPRLFEPFFTTKDVGEGTGLGLAVSYGIARDHGGWFRVESTLGEGTTFTLALPRDAVA